MNLGSNEPQGDLDMENDFSGGDESNSDFDSNFDAGVKADENADPKKYIQQLSGKLSQELRKYNDTQQQPDTELNKYVAGMIIPQASKGMTDNDKQEVIGKLEKGNMDSISQEPSDDENFNGDDFSGEEQPMPMESKMKSFTKKNITEIIDDLIDGDYKRKEKQITNNKLSKTNPFVSKR